MSWGSKRKRSRLTNIGSLPEDLVFEILLHLPAQDFYKSAILVCKKWYNAIHRRNFIDKHLQNSTPGLLLQFFYYHCDDLDNQLTSCFLAMKRYPIEISEFNYKFKGRVSGNCNGLILDCEESEFRLDVCIANPVTKQSFAFPTIYPHWDVVCYPLIPYAEASKQYKVFVMYFGMYERPQTLQSCAIWTVGVDKSWRHLDIKHSHIGFHLSTEGFIHWTHNNGTYLATLNVETEVITDTLVPQSYLYRSKYYLAMGSCLTLLVECGEFSWEVLKMKPETGELWTKMPNIDLEPHKGKLVNLVRERISPVRWLNEEVLVLRIYSSRVCVFYNVRTQQIDFLELELCSDQYFFNVHRNSLVWIDGC